MSSICLILLSLVSLFAEEPKLVSTKIVEGVHAGLPKDFYPMSDDDMASRYPSTKRPVAMYTDIDRMVDFGLNVSKAKFPGSDVMILKEFYKSTILETYEKVDFIKDGIEEINGKKFIVFEFTSYADQTKKYSYLQYALINGFVYIFNFTSADNAKEKWQPVANAIMKTIKIDAKKLYEVAPANPKEPTLRGKAAKDVLIEQNQRKKKNK
ncbi:MAG: hypothetical protein ACK40G_04425 [Cytophagaceae bacterium]